MKTINKNKKEKINAITEALMTESDTLITKISSVTLIIGFCTAVWLSTIEFLIDEVFIERTEKNLIATMVLDKKKPDDKKKVTKKTDIKKKTKNPGKRSGSKGKQVGRGNPKALINRGVLKILSVKKSQSGYNAYKLNDAKLASDINKVLKNISGLQTSGVTRLSGRRGAVNGSLLDGYSAGGGGGNGINLASVLGDPRGALSTKVRGNISAPKMNEIDIGKGNGTRSASSVMRVVRSRTPGLRHIYNKALKSKPGFSGKVTLRFTIAPSGKIINMSILSSTTGYSDFDSKVKAKVKRWVFGKIKSGNTTVTIPFTFSE